MSDQLGIVELGGVCAAMRARSLALFAQIGAWVATTSPGEQQRLFAEACHRHAWHAELWEARAPTIPTAHTPTAHTPTAHAMSPASAAPSPVDGDDTRRERYRAELSSLEDQLRSLRSRIDPALDPSTARTIDLVGRDVVEIAERLDALRSR
jgi:hypothetical protein